MSMSIVDEEVQRQVSQISSLENQSSLPMSIADQEVQSQIQIYFDENLQVSESFYIKIFILCILHNLTSCLIFASFVYRNSEQYLVMKVHNHLVAQVSMNAIHQMQVYV